MTGSQKHTLPETNELPMKITMFPGKYHQHGGFSMAMLVSGRVPKTPFPSGAIWMSRERSLCEEHSKKNQHRSVDLVQWR